MVFDLRDWLARGIHDILGGSQERNQSSTMQQNQGRSQTQNRTQTNTQTQSRQTESPQSTLAQQQQNVTPPQLSPTQLREAIAFNKKAGYYPYLWMEIQKKIGAGADGIPGPETARKLSIYQKANGLPVTGKADEATLQKMKLYKYVNKLNLNFEEMWKAHPHNYQEDESQNTPTSQLMEEIGFPTNWNSCATRLSVMFNRLGGEYKIDRKKAVKAGIRKNRVFYRKGNYYIVSAKEMWQYVSYWFGNPHKKFPKNGRFRSEYEFQQAWRTEIQPFIRSKKGIVAFDKIFGYSGTGHVDIFDGERLSDAPEWYASQQLKLWFV